MSKDRFVSSLNNEHVKHLLSLQEKTRKRKQTQTFVIEGKKEIQHAMAAGYRMLEFWMKEDQKDPFFDKAEEVQVFHVEASIFEKLCYRKKTTKIVAVAQMKNHAITDLAIDKKQGILLVVEAPEKPGNIGALLRSCDALGIDGMLIVDPTTDLYNPNVIRSSVGCLFTVPWATASLEEAFTFFKQNNITVFSAALSPAAQAYTAVDYPQKAALAVGTEHSGLSKKWLAEEAQQPIIIPMQGQNDSLNVSVAAGIILSEMVRQKNM